MSKDYIPFDEAIAMEAFQVWRIALEYDIDIPAASDVVYLRSSSRWTEEREKELIQLHKDGNPPNIFMWP